MMRVPMIVPLTVPRPPMVLVPPITAAAMASIMEPLPRFGEIWPTRLTVSNAATPRNIPSST